MQMMLVASVREKNERIQSWSSFTKISASGTTLANDIATLIKDLQSDPAAATQPDAATVLYVSSLPHYYK